MSVLQQDLHGLVSGNVLRCRNRSPCNHLGAEVQLGGGQLVKGIPAAGISGSPSWWQFACRREEQTSLKQLTPAVPQLTLPHMPGSLGVKAKPTVAIVKKDSKGAQTTRPHIQELPQKQA